MEQEKKIRVAVTHGNTNGTGYEVVLKAFEDPAMLELCTPIIYGLPKVAAYHRKAMEIETSYSIVAQAADAKEGRLNLLTTSDDEVKVEMGQPSDEAERAARTALERALADEGQGLFDVLVTAPAKANDALSHRPDTLTVLVGEELCMAFVTKDVAIKDVSESITKQIVVSKAKMLHTCLKRDLRVSNPRIAMLALNPHGGMDGLPGDEELAVIAPAIEALEQQGIQTFGPYAADTFFGSGDYMQFDAVLAMYYDQGMAPFKTLVGDNYTVLIAGLPVACCAPSHDTDFGQAGKGIADAGPMRRAIYLAIDVCRNRLHYDEPMANPLPKLYHEKRDESEKQRFSVPKTKESREPTRQEKGQEKGTDGPQEDKKQ